MTDACEHCGDVVTMATTNLGTGEVYCDIACALAAETGRDRSEFEAPESAEHPEPNELNDLQ